MKMYTKDKRHRFLLLILLGILGVGLHFPYSAYAFSGNRLVDTGNGIIKDSGNGLMWQAQRSHSFKSLEDAQRYAHSLELGGYTDWRLPTIYELYDLHYLFDLKKGRGIQIKLEGNYWSGKKDGEGMAGSWEIGDQCEPERQYFKKTAGYVRVVRP